MMNDSLLNPDVSVDEQLLNAYRVVYTVSEKNAVLQTENARLTEEINRLKEQLKLAQQNRFGKKSETGELPLPPETSETTDIHVPAHTRKKKTKGCLMDLAALPRHIIIPDNTLGNWVMQVGDALMPLYEALWEELLSSRYLQVDETPIKVLNPNKKGYLWVYYAPHLGGGLIAFEFDLTRKGAVAEQRLSPYQGLLQTDGYNGYEKLRQREDIEGLGCLTHARRKFAEVVKISKNPEGIAAEAIERLKPLYALEARMRDNQYAFHTRKRLRQKMALPILRDFKRWLKQMAPRVSPKSTLGNAIQYTLNQWPYLIKYCRHGIAEIDTNWVENKIRNVALGKKNWLFMGNEDSGAVHALFYSLLLSAMANNLNPRIYLHYLIMQVHAIRRKEVAPNFQFSVS